MTLQQYIKQLQDIAKANPELLKQEVVFSSDSEGNAYYPVQYSALPGKLEGRDFEETSPQKATHVCIN